MPFRDLRIGRLRSPYSNKPFFKWGTSTLPFTLEERHYIYIGRYGFEFWTGPKEVQPDLFASD